ncbi:hypothetical protein AAVH_19452 [Aphelenchoides avenae]|nr:hypothetical protein AAVH_19452 [Aphelenchus avenae]
MSPLVKLTLVALLVQLVVGYYQVGRGCMGGRCWKQGDLTELCNNQPRRPICKRLGLGPIYGGQDVQGQGGLGPESDETDPNQLSYVDPDPANYAKH